MLIIMINEFLNMLDMISLKKIIKIKSKNYKFKYLNI